MRRLIVCDSAYSDMSKRRSCTPSAPSLDHLGLADARRPREEEGAHGTLGMPSPERETRIAETILLESLVLTEHSTSNDLVERGELTVLALGTLGRNAGHARDGSGSFCTPTRWASHSPPPCSCGLRHRLHPPVSGKGLSVIQRSATPRPFCNLGRVMHAVVLLELRKHAVTMRRASSLETGASSTSLQTTRRAIVLAEGLAPGAESGRRDEAQRILAP